MATNPSTRQALHAQKCNALSTVQQILHRVLPKDEQHVFAHLSTAPKHHHEVLHGDTHDSDAV